MLVEGRRGVHPREGATLLPYLEGPLSGDRCVCGASPSELVDCFVATSLRSLVAVDEAGGGTGEEIAGRERGSNLRGHRPHRRHPRALAVEHGFEEGNFEVAARNRYESGVEEKFGGTVGQDKSVEVRGHSSGGFAFSPTPEPGVLLRGTDRFCELLVPPGRELRAFVQQIP